MGQFVCQYMCIATKVGRIRDHRIDGGIIVISLSVNISLLSVVFPDIDKQCAPDSVLEEIFQPIYGISYSLFVLCHGGIGVHLRNGPCVMVHRVECLHKHIVTYLAHILRTMVVHVFLQK